MNEQKEYQCPECGREYHTLWVYILGTSDEPVTNDELDAFENQLTNLDFLGGHTKCTAHYGLIYEDAIDVVNFECEGNYPLTEGFSNKFNDMILRGYAILPFGWNVTVMPRIMKN